MAIEARIDPDFGYRIPIVERARAGEIFYDYDKVVGRLVVAKSLAGNLGAVMSTVDDFHESPNNLSPIDFFDLLSTANTRVNLLPYLRTLLPTHFDNGEPATLNLRYLPPVVLVPYRHLDSALD